MHNLSGCGITADQAGVVRGWRGGDAGRGRMVCAMDYGAAEVCGGTANGWRSSTGAADVGSVATSAAAAATDRTSSAAASGSAWEKGMVLFNVFSMVIADKVLRQPGEKV